LLIAWSLEQAHWPDPYLTSEETGRLDYTGPL
jgi:hypothetical protein